MLILTTNIAHLQEEFNSRVYTSHNATWSKSRDVLTLLVWGYNIPGKEYAVEFIFQIEGGKLRLVSTWVRVRSDGLYQVTPNQHLERALELQKRILRWFNRRSYARQVTAG